MILDQAQVEKIINLRKQLHQHPELSDKEVNTGTMIREFIKNYPPDEVLGIANTGLIFIYEGNYPGPAVCFRCELDALPIEEINSFEYRSTTKGISHACGHDGHMAMVTGMGMIFGNKRPEKGRIILLYQPSEETGAGAAKIIADPVFKQLAPDYIIGLHNLPKYPSGTIVVKENEFAASSKGIEVKLKGATSHAAEPENGINPSNAIAEIIQQLTKLPKQNIFESFNLVTIIHVLLGDIAFGTSPGYGEVRATLRSFKEADMEILTRESVELVKNIAEKYKLKIDFNFTEIFPATRCDPELYTLITNSADQLNFKITEISEPFRWSEDFGHYSKVAKTGFFGIGAGKRTPDLHNADYDFPDEIIPVGIQLYYQLATNIINR